MNHTCYLLGRLANGAERDSGATGHLIPDGSWIALCGRKPRSGSAGWSQPVTDAPAWLKACPRCYRIAVTPQPSTPDPRLAAAQGLADALKAIVPEGEDWWCPTCKESLGGSRVTHSECCDTCGTYLGGIAAPEWLQSARAALTAWGKAVR